MEPLRLQGVLSLVLIKETHSHQRRRRNSLPPSIPPPGVERKTPHATRHTYASRARKAGMPPEILQKILGHADYNTTANIYVHADAEELVMAVEKN